MLLKLHTFFEDNYIVNELIDNRSPCREVYRVKVKDKNCFYTKDQMLVVYDLKNLPDYFDNSEIPEFNAVKNATNGVMPKFVDEGIYEDDEVRLSWMVMEFVDGVTLAEYLQNNEEVNVDVLLQQFQKILVELGCVSVSTGYVCHNNINCDNIVVTSEDDGSIRLRLLGMGCISKECAGNVLFDNSLQSDYYRAPETFLNIYNSSTDVFSLGIVLAMILQEKHPWQNVINANDGLSLKKYIKMIRQEDAVLDMPDKYKSIVAKAIATNPTMRYETIEKFCCDLERHLDLYLLDSYSVNSFYAKHKICENETKNAYDDEEDDGCEYDSFNSQLPAQPTVNISVERVEGNGFKDVAGMHQLKSKLSRNFIDILQNKDLAKHYKIMPPNGILLWGPPGNGKTFISRKLAEESGMMFCLVKPSDLGNIYIHGSQKMIADLFKRCEKMAKKNKCGVLLVFDEFDSLVPSRDNVKTDNHADEVAELLTQLNNCAEKNIFVIGTTNRIDAVDGAVLRKGRMDELVYVGLPDKDARKELFEIELKGLPCDILDIERLVDLTEGYSSSDISFIVKECARCSFAEALMTKTMINISQTLLEKTVASTNPSVSSDEIRRYEKINESFSKGKNNDRPRIGFNL